MKTKKQLHKEKSLKFAIRELDKEDVLNSSDEEFQNFKLITKDPLMRKLKNMYNKRLINIYDKEVKCKPTQEVYLEEELLLLKTLVWNVKEDFLSKELYINFCFDPEESLEKIKLYEYVSISDIIELSKENM